MLRVGLTGGIGSGKSTVAAMFHAMGVPILDLDQLGRVVTAPESTGLQALVQAFGTGIQASDGSLDRQALATYCFADAARTTQLNSILHPLIWQQEEQWLACQRAPYVLIEASVLLESGGAARMDKLIVVLADEQLRLQRVLTRGSHQAAAFRAIVARQCDDKQRRSLADYIINNNGELATLHDQVQAVHSELSLSAR
ncbi:MAG: dephospho-CoA kinase [Mariprofundus sp.]